MNSTMFNPVLPTASPTFAWARSAAVELLQSSQWQWQTPMREGKFQELMRGFLLRAGVPPPEASASTFKTLRRFVPSVAECLGLDDAALASLGNWAEVSKPTGSSSHSSGRAGNPAALAYCADKFTTSAVNRHVALISLHFAAAHIPEGTVKNDGMLAHDAMPWDLIRTASQHVESCLQLAVGPPRGL